MNEKRFLVNKKDGGLKYHETLFLKDPSDLSKISHKLRISILRMISQKPMYASQIAKKLGIHEQKIYYHIKILSDAGIIQEVERKEIRGATAKMFSTDYTHFSTAISQEKPGESFEKLKEQTEMKTKQFFGDLISNGDFNGKIIVGSPDPHGPHKARARDGHYAVDLGIFLGNISKTPEKFIINLDVDTDIKTNVQNLVIVGGPVTNLLTEEINQYLDKGFTSRKPWGLKGNKIHTEDTVGIIAKLPNPYKPSLSLYILAGIGNVGTKAAVIAITRHTQLTLTRFTGQKRFSAIVQGFDLDGDGRIDSIELLE